MSVGKYQATPKRLEERRKLESGEVHWMPCAAPSALWGVCKNCRIGFPQWCNGRGGSPKKRKP